MRHKLSIIFLSHKSDHAQSYLQPNHCFQNFTSCSCPRQNLTGNLLTETKEIPHSQQKASCTLILHSFCAQFTIRLQCKMLTSDSHQIWPDIRINKLSMGIASNYPETLNQNNTNCNLFSTDQQISLYTGFHIFFPTPLLQMCSHLTVSCPRSDWWLRLNTWAVCSPYLTLDISPPRSLPGSSIGNTGRRSAAGSGPVWNGVCGGMAPCPHYGYHAHM